MTTSNSISFRTGKGFTALLLLPLMMLLGSAPAFANFIQIDFAATISNDGGITTDDVTGQFILDTSVFFGIDVGAVDDVITEGSATLFGNLETLDPDSGFTFVSAGSRPGFGVLTLIGDYGSGNNFALDLASAGFFSGLNVFDDLTEDLLLASLLDFAPNEALGTTRVVNQFINGSGNLEVWEGALTSLTIAAIPEPGIMWLFLLAVPGFVYWRRRT